MRREETSRPGTPGLHAVEAEVAVGEHAAGPSASAGRGPRGPRSGSRPCGPGRVRERTPQQRVGRGQPGGRPACTPRPLLRAAGPRRPHGRWRPAGSSPLQSRSSRSCAVEVRRRVARSPSRAPGPAHAPARAERHRGRRPAARPRRRARGLHQRPRRPGRAPSGPRSPAILKTKSSPPVAQAQVAATASSSPPGSRPAARATSRGRRQSAQAADGQQRSPPARAPADTPERAPAEVEGKPSASARPRAEVAARQGGRHAVAPPCSRPPR